MKKSFLFAALVAVVCAVLSCSSDNEVFENQTEQEQPTGKAHVRLVCGMGVEVSPQGARQKAVTRAALTANDSQLTDLYILDYDKPSGRLLQVLHQTSTAADFAEPDLTLDYGEHTLKVVATRSTSPTLLDADSQPWNVTANVLTAVSGSVPTVWTSAKTSDSFGAVKDVSVGIGKATTVSITLERLVAKLVVVSTDEFPAECSTIDMALNEYKTFSWQTFNVMDAVRNQRTSDVSPLAGTKGTTITYYFLAPQDGYTTDITFTTNSRKGAPYAAITVPSVPLERNKVTTITGSFYNHQQGFSIAVNDIWDSEGHDINI